jgi:hypothetical protein
MIKFILLAGIAGIVILVMGIRKELNKRVNNEKTCEKFNKEMNK